MDIIIFSGQSNMQGQTEGLPKRNKPIKNAYEYLLTVNKFIPLRHPVGETFTTLKDGKYVGLISESSEKGGNLIPAFCKAYVKKTKCEKLIAIHCAQGATVISDWQKSSENQRYNLLIKKISDGIALAQKSNEKIENVYFVWLQGESDAIISTSEKDYCEMLTKFKKDVFSDVEKTVGIKIDKFCVISQGYFASICNWVLKMLSKDGVTKDELIKRDESIFNAQERFVKENVDCIMLTKIARDLCKDSEMINPFAEGHFNNKALNIIGRTAGTELANVKLLN